MFNFLTTNIYTERDVLKNMEIHKTRFDSRGMTLNVKKNIFEKG